MTESSLGYVLTLGVLLLLSSSLAACSSSDSSGSGGGTSSCLKNTGGSGGTTAGDAGGEAPVATILKPTPNQTFAPADTIVMQGSATDPQDGAITSSTSLFWFNDKEPDPSGEGTEDQQPALASGPHTIRFVAFDKQCNMGSSEVSITVQ